MTERKILPRKHDKWMVPIVLALVPALLGGAMWVQAQQKDMTACADGVRTNKIHIQTLEQNTAEIQAALLVNSNTLRNIDKSVTKMATKQDKDNDKVEQRLEKLTDLVIKLIQNGDGP